MPKQRRERTRGRTKGPLNTNIPDLKNKICTKSSSLIMSGGRINIILDYLNKVQSMSRDRINKDKIPSIDELKGDLIKGFKILNTFSGDLIGTPSLNQSEQNSIYLTSEEAKKIQLKKDDWLQRFTDSDNKNIMEWLTDDSVNKMFELSDDVPVTPRILTEEMGDQWEDISVIYNNMIDYLRSRESEAGVTELLRKMPSNLPLTHISINVGKISDYQSFIIEMGETLLKRSSNLAQNLATILGKLGLVTLKIGGYTMALTTKFISDLFINIFRNNINTGLWNIIKQVVGGTFDTPFVISDNKIEIQGKINHKYRIFLCLIIIKIIFMLGNLIFKTEVIDSALKLRQLMNFGMELLNSYNTDKNYKSLSFVGDKFPDIRIKIDDIMKDMNKLTEWYLMRKTIVFNINNNELLSLEDKKEYRTMTASEIDGNASKRKKRSKRREASKKKKRQTKRRKKK